MAKANVRRQAFVGIFFALMLVLGLTAACGTGGGGTGATGDGCTNGCPRVSGSCGTFCSCSVFNCSFGGCCYVTPCSCDPSSCGCF